MRTRKGAPKRDDNLTRFNLARIRMCMCQSVSLKKKSSVSDLNKKMIEPSISLSSENANIMRLPGNAKSNPSKGLKKRSKALTDVKNTLHSHSSTVAEKCKDSGKNLKKDGGLSSIAKLKKGSGSKTSFNIFGAENEVENKFHSDFECHNHLACEKANALNEAEFLAEYKLKEKEINYWGDRMKFCQLDSVPVRVNIAEPVEDLEIIDVKRNWCDDIQDDVMSIEVPEPSFL